MCCSVGASVFSASKRVSRQLWRSSSDSRLLTSSKVKPSCCARLMRSKTNVKLRFNTRKGRQSVRDFLSALRTRGSVGATRHPLNCATRAQHYCEATFVRNGTLEPVNQDVSQRRQTAPVDRRPQCIRKCSCVVLRAPALHCIRLQWRGCADAVSS